MLRLVRGLGFLLGAVVTSALAVALFLHLTWDGQRLRAELTREVREQTARGLAMAAPPSLKFQPLPTVRIDALALGEPAAPGVAARIGRIEARLALLPLLRGRIEISELRIIDADVHLTRLPDGSLSLADLAHPTVSAGNWPFRSALERLSVERSRLTYRSPGQATAFKLERVSVSLDALQPGSRGRLRGEATLVQAPLPANGGVSLTVEYQLGPKGVDIGFARLGFRGEAYGITALDVGLTAQAGRADTGQAIALQRLAIDGEGRRGPQTLRLTSAAESLSAQRGALTVRGLEGRIRADDGRDRRSDLRFTAPALGPRDENLPGEPLALRFRFDDGTRRTEGALDARLAYRAARQQLGADSLNAHWTTRGPGAPEAGWVSRVGGSALISDWGQQARLRLSGMLAGSRWTLELDYRPDRTTPWQGALGVDRLDLARASPALFGTPPRDALAWLAGLHADTRLHADSVSGLGLRARDLNARLQTDGRTLRLDPLDASAYGGKLSGALTYDPARDRLRIDQQIYGLALGSLTGELRRSLPLQGTLDGQLTAELQPGPWPTVAGTLEGAARLSLRDGSWQGMAVDEFLRQVRPALKDRSPASRASVPRERQGLERLGMQCQFADGRARCSDVNGGAPWLQLAGGGEVNLADGQLDWLLRLRPQAARTLPRDLTGLRGVTVPVRLRGPLAKPVWALDWSAAPPRAAPPRPAPAPPAPPASAPAEGPRAAS